MSARRVLLACAGVALLTGCSQLDGMATRYRAERMAWDAQRRETQLRIGKGAPDSTTLFRIRAEYQKLRQTFRPPFVGGEGWRATLLRRDIGRQVGRAELTASRIALEARRPDLALESARWVGTIADGDTSLHRDADIGVVMALRALGRYPEAIATMRGMLDRYLPAPPRSLDQEDPILDVPQGIIELQADLGDSSQVMAERARAVAYYRKLLARGAPPLLEAQIRSRLSRMLLELGKNDEALLEVVTLRKLAERTPELHALEPELLFTEARVRGLKRDFQASLSMYDDVTKRYPSSSFAPRAMLDGAIVAERMGDTQGAIARYRSIMDRRDIDPGIGAVASYRLAMVKDQAGEWDEAKQILESISTKYPKSRAGVEAPFAIAEHYFRTRQTDAAKTALLKAVDTYRSMIGFDTLSQYATVYRWNILRAYTALQRWSDALATVDLMADKDRGAPITSEALFQGAQIAHSVGDKPRAERYLQRIVMEYPGSPRALIVRKLLESSGAGPGKR